MRWILSSAYDIQAYVSLLGRPTSASIVIVPEKSLQNKLNGDAMYYGYVEYVKAMVCLGRIAYLHDSIQ